MRRSTSPDSFAPVFENLESRLLLNGAPPVPVLVDLQAASDSGISNIDNLTNIKTGIVDITATAGYTVHVYRDGTQLGTAGFVSGTTYRYTFGASDLQEGANSITARTDNGAVESGDSSALVITLDTTPPQVSSNTPNGFAAGPVDSFQVTFNEPINPATFTPGDVSITSPAGASGVFPVTSTGATTNAVAVSGNIMYEATAQSLRIYNVTTPSSPALVGQWVNPDPSNPLIEVTVSGAQVYLSAGAAGDRKSVV